MKLIDAEAMDAAIDAFIDFGRVQVPEAALRRSLETGEPRTHPDLPAAIRRLRLSVGVSDDAIRVLSQRATEFLAPQEPDPYTAAFKGMIVALRARELADERSGT